MNELVRKIKEHKIVAGVAGLFVIIPILVIITGTRPASDSSDSVTQETKEVVAPTDTLAYPTLDASAVQALRIVSISPENNDVNVGLYPDIVVKFASQVSPEQQKQTTLMVVPHVEGQLRWIDNGWTVAFTPSNTLASNQLYKATISSQGVSLTWSFQTALAEHVNIEDQRRSQAESDANYKQWEEDTYSTYPWLDKLPLQTENYYAYFDLEKKSFVGLLYPQTSDMQPVEAQVDAMKTDILTSLKKLGIDPSKYPFEWVVSPK